MPIDKDSALITLLLSFWLLREPFTPKISFGAAFVLGDSITLTPK